MPKTTICLWYDDGTEDAARFCAQTFPGSRVRRAPAGVPGGPASAAYSVSFTVCGVAYLGLNGGDRFTLNEAFSFQAATEYQDETDRYWDALTADSGQESRCGWCKDRWGVSWQITPRVLMDTMAAGGAPGQRAVAAMMGMRKIDVAAIAAAIAGSAQQ